jgi:hypothetical protein
MPPADPIGAALALWIAGLIALGLIVWLVVRRW